MRKVGISIDELFVKHENGFDHPESPDRVYAINDMLNQTQIIKNLKILKARDASKEEILSVHTDKYYEKIKSTKGKEKVFLDQDTSTNWHSYDAAIRASGGVLQSIDEIINKEINIGFVIERPPGHHAEADRAMGFCLFNHIAVGAGYLMSKGFSRILIIDWDVHHGNGTQHIFESSKNVLFFSTHQFPFYPGTGSIGEKGADEGTGYTVNVPLSPGMGDSEYIKIFQEILIPVTAQYKPEFILVSAGFDSYIDDPLGGMQVTPVGFSRLTEIVINLSEQFCDGKLIFVLEGGYNLNGLWECTNKVFETLLNYDKTDSDNLLESTKADNTIDEIKKSYSQFWQF
jgi:acetoin utilization deacetylase AcuC-like enzyme